jgi:hypothetical protein
VELANKFGELRKPSSCLSICIHGLEEQFSQESYLPGELKNNASQIFDEYLSILDAIVKIHKQEQC